MILISNKQKLDEINNSSLDSLYILTDFDGTME